MTELPPLRILFLVGRDARHPAVGGGDLQAWEWARWCTERGHQVVLICQSHPSLPKVECLDGIRVLRLGTKIALALRAYRYYRRHAAEFDLVYEDPIGAGRSPYLSPVYSRVPVVAVWHQVSAPLLRALHGAVAGFAMSAVERIVALMYRRCLLWVPSEERAAEIARDLGFDRSRIFVISPTVQPHAAPANSVLSRPPTVLFLGVMRRYKSIEHVIRALPKVATQVAMVRLVVAGRRLDATYEASLRALATELEVGDRVEFILDVTESEKHELLAAARVLVLPSLLEGFGIVALEADAVGTPIVASSGVPVAAVAHERNGLRFAYGDIEQLGEALVRLLSDDELAATCSSNGLAMVESFYPDAVGVEFNRLLTSALAHDHRRGAQFDKERETHAKT